MEPHIATYKVGFTHPVKKGYIKGAILRFQDSCLSIELALYHRLLSWIFIPGDVLDNVTIPYSMIDLLYESRIQLPSAPLGRPAQPVRDHTS